MYAKLADHPTPRTVGVVTHPFTGRRYHVKLVNAPLAFPDGSILVRHYATVSPLHADGTLVVDRVRTTATTHSRDAAFDAALALVDDDARRDLIASA